MSRYRIERLIGMGGLGMVYEARMLLPAGLSMPVACKLVRDDRRDLPRYRDYVRREAAISMQLGHNHPNLVTVFDYFEDARGRPCMVLELVDGGSVADLLDVYPGLPSTITRRIAVKVLAALAYLHGAHVLHRDLSPCNVLVSTAGDVKLSDLNLVKVLEQGQAHTHTFRGKPAYASPEALACATIDARSDLYSLGAVLYQMLAGKPPCGDAHEPARILERARREDFAPLPVSTPRDLAELTMGLLRAEPGARRPQRAAEALAFLRGSGEPLADRAELGGLVTLMQGRRGAQRDGNAAPAPGEIVAPGEVLVSRAMIGPEPGAPEPGAVEGAAGALPARDTASVSSDELLHSLLRAPPSRDTKSMPESAGGAPARRGRAARAARVIALVGAGVVLGVWLHGRVSGPDEPARPPAPIAQQPVPALVQERLESVAEPPAIPGEQRIAELPAPARVDPDEQRLAELPAPAPVAPGEQRIAELPAPARAPSRKRAGVQRERQRRADERRADERRADERTDSRYERGWYEVPRVERTPWHIYLAGEPADGPATEPVEEERP